MSETAIIALLQINVAIGCLYCGLPLARYRNRLYDVIVATMNSLESPYVDVANELASVFKDNDRLSSSHHHIRQWAGELPESHLEKIKGFDRWNIGDDPSLDLPIKYRLYFRKHLDKVLTWLITVGASLSLIWLALFGAKLSDYCSVISIVFVGQIIPPFNVFFGRRMIRIIGDGVKEKLKEVEKEYEKRKVSKAVGKAQDVFERNAV